MKRKIILEVVCFNTQSAIEAQKGGAGRVELCGNLAEGGTTPSFGTIKMARENLTIGLNVMIRPRGGDFLYSDLEYDIMKQDIRACKSLGADGVVFGILQSNGTVDNKRCHELRELARPMSATFHRAFDMTSDPFRSLEDIIWCGFDRILTSGQKAKASDGAVLLSQLVQKAENRIIIMPGGGIRSSNIQELIAGTGAFEFHTSARLEVPSRMEFKNKNVSMGGTVSIDEFKILGVDSFAVQDLGERINRTQEDC